ncbi:actin-related protein 5 isoform X2 [Condylostylus longicornis]|uniref:actin-related protein 5 isoform X2 n=1 Tax=Condylostylus longicornis TaxID=2530218 RepID=UPI00244DFDD6|nr:actin-related protein 5 isoform X2 [Condylostylus longicornis]
MTIIQLSDTKCSPDKFFHYSEALKASEIPLVIDNGSYRCRVGWNNSNEPLMCFRNLIAKPRKDRGKKDSIEPFIEPPIQIGNDIVNIEAMRFQLKSQFDKNVVTHYYNQEQIFDYIFTHLSIDTDSAVLHPIVMTECIGNPNHCRNLMSELLFECYDVPSVCYGIDALYSFAHNNIGSHGLVISCGYHTTHVIPVLNKRMIGSKARRLNLGGFHMISFLHKILQLKYPVHVNAISISRIEDLLHKYCSVVSDYTESLKNWSNLDYYEENVKKIQLPFIQQTISTALTMEQKLEKKKEMSRRLVEIAARKREERLAEDEDHYQKMLNIKALYDDGHEREFEIELNNNDIANLEELIKMINNVKAKIERTRHRMMLPIEAPSGEKPVPTLPPDVNVEEWISNIKNKRSQILEHKQARKQRRQDLAKRRTAAAQERMRIISQLARKEKGSDDFGMRDEDWDVYKTISRENGDSDSEVENEKLIEYEDILRHWDPTFEEPIIVTAGTAEFHQLHVGVEAIRAPELLFQPSMIGSGEAGLAEVMDYIFKLFNADDQQLLADNVFLTGGCSQFPVMYMQVLKNVYQRN